MQTKKTLSFSAAEVVEALALYIEEIFHDEKTANLIRSDSVVIEATRENDSLNIAIVIEETNEEYSPDKKIVDECDCEMPCPEGCNCKSA